MSTTRRSDPIHIISMGNFIPRIQNEPIISRSLTNHIPLSESKLSRPDKPCARSLASSAISTTNWVLEMVTKPTCGIGGGPDGASIGVGVAGSNGIGVGTAGVDVKVAAGPGVAAGVALIATVGVGGKPGFGVGVGDPPHAASRRTPARPIKAVRVIFPGRSIVSIVDLLAWRDTASRDADMRPESRCGRGAYGSESPTASGRAHKHP